MTTIDGTSALTVVVVITYDDTANDFCTLDPSGRRKRAIFSIDQNVLIDALDDPAV